MSVSNSFLSRTNIPEAMTHAVNSFATLTNERPKMAAEDGQMPPCRREEELDTQQPISIDIA